MIKIFFTASAACILVNAYSQVDFGIKGGINLSNTKYTYPGQSLYQTPAYPGYTSLAGYNFGLLAHIKITKRVFLRPEIEYSTEGFKYPALAAEATPSGAIHLNYINVPVLFLAKLSTKFFVFVGPQFGLLTNAKSATNNVNNPYLKSGFKSYDIGLDAGAAYYFAKNFGAEARYYYGLTHIQNPFNLADANANILAGYPQSGANRVFQASIFYMLTK